MRFGPNPANQTHWGEEEGFEEPAVDHLPAQRPGAIAHWVLCSRLLANMLDEAMFRLHYTLSYAGVDYTCASIIFFKMEVRGTDPRLRQVMKAGWSEDGSIFWMTQPPASYLETVSEDRVRYMRERGFVAYQ